MNDFYSFELEKENILYFINSELGVELYTLKLIKFKYELLYNLLDSINTMMQIFNYLYNIQILEYFLLYLLFDHNFSILLAQKYNSIKNDGKKKKDVSQ